MDEGHGRSSRHRVLGACAALLALPLLVLGVTVASAWRAWVERRARRGAWGHRRELTCAPPEEWFFFWTCSSEEEAARALRDALGAAVEALPAALGLPALERLEILNPTSGFVVDPAKLRPITRDFAAEAAAMLHGEHTELATLLVNGCHRIGLTVDARSFVSGDLALLLEAPAPEEVVAEVKRRFADPADAPESGHTA